MAEPQETREEQETRWAAQRATRAKQFAAGQTARQQQRRRTWLVGALGLIVVVIAAVVVL